MFNELLIATDGLIMTDQNSKEPYHKASLYPPAISFPQGLSMASESKTGTWQEAERGALLVPIWCTKLSTGLISKLSLSTQEQLTEGYRQRCRMEIDPESVILALCCPICSGKKPKHKQFPTTRQCQPRDSGLRLGDTASTGMFNICLIYGLLAL